MFTDEFILQNSTRYVFSVMYFTTCVRRLSCSLTMRGATFFQYLLLRVHASLRICFCTPWLRHLAEMLVARGVVNAPVDHLRRITAGEAFGTEDKCAALYLI